MHESDLAWPTRCVAFVRLMFGHKAIRDCLPPSNCYERVSGRCLCVPVVLMVAEFQLTSAADAMPEDDITSVDAPSPVDIALNRVPQ